MMEGADDNGIGGANHPIPSAENDLPTTDDPLARYNFHTNASDVPAKLIPQMVELTRSLDSARKLKGLALLNKVVHPPWINDVMAVRFYEPLIDVLQSNLPSSGKADASAVLWRVTTVCSEEQRKQFVGQELITGMAHLLRTTDDWNCVHCAAGFLEHILHWGAAYCTQVVAQDPFPSIEKHLLKCDLTPSYPQLSVAALFAGIVGHLPPPTRIRAMSLASKLLTRKPLNTELRGHTLWALANFAGANPNGTHLLLSSGVMRLVLSQLQGTPGLSNADTDNIWCILESTLKSHQDIGKLLQLPEFVAACLTFLPARPTKYGIEVFKYLTTVVTTRVEFARIITKEIKLMQETVRCFADYNLDFSTRFYAMQLITAVLSMVGHELLGTLISSCGLLDAFVGALHSTDMVLRHEALPALKFLFSAAVEVSVESEEEEVEEGACSILTILEAVLRNSFETAKKGNFGDEFGKEVKRLWSLYFDDISPLYLRVVHRKRLLQYAVPQDLICSKDILDRVSSFLPILQLHPNLEQCSLDDFPWECQLGGNQWNEELLSNEEICAPTETRAPQDSESRSRKRSRDETESSDDEESD
jgi:hypothetical protein